MRSVPDSIRNGALFFKYVTVAIGVVAAFISLDYVINEYYYLSLGSFGFVDIILIAAIVAIVLSSVALVASLPSSFRVRFERPRKPSIGHPTYGFTTMLAVGLGATLGSPLFILIPLNIVQYEFVSLGSLVIATVLSVLMAKVYSDMYSESARLGLESVGGPSFTKAATGGRSVRYFISRLSMWVANTALAAYSKIVFIVFDFELMPGILANLGITGPLSTLIVYLITGVFLAWTVLNALFEVRFLKMIGYLQIALTSVMVVILLYQSVLLGDAGSWNLTGILHTGLAGGNWPLALIVNTGYLYLLFFGFQEIQALEKDALEYSSIPVISWIKKGFTVTKFKYLGLAMIGSVVIAAIVNILYGIAVYSLHPSLNALNESSIPALYVTNLAIGPEQELITAIVFLIATITTFVPAFLAASRHLEALAHDGFIPRSFSKLSYVFTLAAILILALGNENFLIDITDFLVLISLGIISLSAIWLRGHSLTTLSGKDALPLVVGVSCFVAGSMIYLISPSVAVFGSIGIVVTYLMYVVYELGYLGSQLFLGILDGIVGILLVVYPHYFPEQNFFLFSWLGLRTSDTGELAGLLGICALFLFVNVLVDYLFRTRTETTNWPIAIPAR
jgi:amino acid transporter